MTETFEITACVFTLDGYFVDPSSVPPGKLPDRLDRKTRRLANTLRGLHNSFVDVAISNDSITLFLIPDVLSEAELEWKTRSAVIRHHDEHGFALAGSYPFSAVRFAVMKSSDAPLLGKLRRIACNGVQLYGALAGKCDDPEKRRCFWQTAKVFALALAGSIE